jgi:hypothetical protein
MELSIQIILGAVAVICFLGGTNIFVKGAKYFLPDGTPPQVVLDNLLRFLSGIYLGLGFLFAWASLNVLKINELVYFLGVVVAFSGLGRLYSRIKVGPGGKYLHFIMILEIILGIALVLLQYLR